MALSKAELTKIAKYKYPKHSGQIPKANTIIYIIEQKHSSFAPADPTEVRQAASNKAKNHPFKMRLLRVPRD